MRCLDYIVFLILLTSGLSAEPLVAARQGHLDDLVRHHRNALNGESAVEIDAGEETFLALSLRQRTGKPQGGILILHDQGHNPDWPERLRQARIFLPDVGWDTLSIALPMPDNQDDDRVAQQTLGRIAAGLRRLNRQGQFNIVLLGYGDGAYWAARYMAERLQPDEEVGYALVMVATTPDRPDLPALLGRLDIPVLDLYFNNTPWARSNARKRQAEAARNKRQEYTQILDPAAGSFHNETRPSRDTRRLWGWLRTNAAGREGDINPTDEE